METNTGAVENLTVGSQSEQYLALLLKYLACPIDNSISLTAIRDSDGKIVALKSKGGEYPVINNVPCMVPDRGRNKDGSYTLWQELQNAVWRDYKNGHEDVFSAEDDPVGCGVGQIIDQTGDGLFLDVGCGVLPLPSYMVDVSSEHVLWIGVDPYFGHVARQFPFVQGLGECLPFRSEVFDGVLFAGVIDHVIDPFRSLVRARSIIKPKGKLFIWYILRQVDLWYIVWKTARKLGFVWRYNKNHQWAFTHETLRALLKSTGFVTEEVIPLCEDYCPDYRGCSEPVHFLAIASPIYQVA